MSFVGLLSLQYMKVYKIGNIRSSFQHQVAIEDKYLLAALFSLKHKQKNGKTSAELNEPQKKVGKF